MLTTAHRRFGAFTVLALNAAGVGAHVSLVGTIIAASSAAVFAGGRTSPDIDQRKWWKDLDTLMPDEVLGHGGPLGHRQITHWWGFPAFAALSWWAFVPATPSLIWTVLFGAWIGWCSHLVGDAIFGKGNPRYGMGKGVPMLPWWGHVGLGLKCGGWAERITSGLLVVGITIAAVSA
jgi:membrane-bound metal-dependent hydrolase YbcI (DUF457 family)